MNAIIKLANFFKRRDSHRAFTLLEIMIVVLILGVVASLALNNFNKVVEQGYCRNAQQNLVLIHQAQQINILKEIDGSGAANLTQINSNLSLSIPLDPKFDYSHGGLWVGTGSTKVISPATLTAVRKIGGPTYTCSSLLRQPLTATNPTCTGADAATYCSPILQ